MAFFDPSNGTMSERHRKVYALYEFAFTLVDFSAAILFLVGSILFFYKPLENAAIWCFVIGSACFAAKPAIRVGREVHYIAIGDYSDLARSAP